MFLRSLFAGLALCAVLFATGCHCNSCRREVIAPAAPGCSSCGGGPGVPGAPVVPPAPAPVGAFATPTTGAYAVPR